MYGSFAPLKLLAAFAGLIVITMGLSVGLVYASCTGAGCTAAGSAPANVIDALCGIINTIGTVIAIFSLVMFILGGTLYALAHFLPAAGNFRSGLQGWGMGMIIGGIVALILYIAAPYIVTTVANFGNVGSLPPGLSGIQAINCNS